MMNEKKARTNPFFEPYNTPHDTAPFDRIRMEDFEEAMLEGIRRDDEQIERIINNPAKPTRPSRLRPNGGCLCSANPGLGLAIESATVG